MTVPLTKRFSPAAGEDANTRPLVAFAIALVRLIDG
jgi:hypothetical protein